MGLEETKNEAEDDVRLAMASWAQRSRSIGMDGELLLLAFLVLEWLCDNDWINALTAHIGLGCSEMGVWVAAISKLGAIMSEETVSGLYGQIPALSNVAIIVFGVNTWICAAALINRKFSFETYSCFSCSNQSLSLLQHFLKTPKMATSRP